VRWLLAFAAVLLLAGCGAAMSEQAGVPVVPDAPSPAIVAVNEAPPDDVLWFLRAEFGQELASADSSSSNLGGSISICEVTDTSGVGPPPTLDGNSCPQPTAEEQARFDAQEQRYEQAIRPAPGSEPRVVARLPLGAGSDLLFTAWKSNSGALCWQTDETGADGGGGGGPSGPCAQQAQSEAYPELAAGLGPGLPSCGVICLASEGGSGDGGADTYLLSGTVPLDAEAIRVTVAGGMTATYALVGPRVLDSDRRVFLLELGAYDWRKLELIRRGAVAATAQMPAFTAAYEDCTDTIGPPPQPPATADPQAMLDAMRPYDTTLMACVRASGALPALGLPQAHLP
jgi:hypothetical protein